MLVSEAENRICPLLHKEVNVPAGQYYSGPAYSCCITEECMMWLKKDDKNGDCAMRLRKSDGCKSSAIIFKKGSGRK